MNHYIPIFGLDLFFFHREGNSVWCHDHQKIFFDKAHEELLSQKIRSEIVTLDGRGEHPATVSLGRGHYSSSHNHGSGKWVYLQY